MSSGLDGAVGVGEPLMLAATSGQLRSRALRVDYSIEAVLNNTP
jgi:hypothetical protein